MSGFPGNISRAYQQLQEAALLNCVVHPGRSVVGPWSPQAAFAFLHRQVQSLEAH
jgi:hypothetical protein